VGDIEDVRPQFERGDEGSSGSGGPWQLVHGAPDGAAPGRLLPHNRPDAPACLPITLVWNRRVAFTETARFNTHSGNRARTAAVRYVC
jgi:hypothetical protein